jgi:hypothetical protein
MKPSDIASPDEYHVGMGEVVEVFTAWYAYFAHEHLITLVGGS